jgi:hypothetical protein
MISGVGGGGIMGTVPTFICRITFTTAQRPATQLVETRAKSPIILTAPNNSIIIQIKAYYGSHDREETGVQLSRSRVHFGFDGYSTHVHCEFLCVPKYCYSKS